MTVNVSANRKIEPSDPLALVHTPGEIAGAFVQWDEENKRYPGVRFGIPAVDRRVIPLRPGRAAFIIARPGGGKTSLMAALAKKEALRIAAEGNGKEAIVIVTWEQVVEELEAFFMSDGEFSASDIAWCRVDSEQIRRKAVKRPELPIWMIGYSLARVEKATPEMTLDNVLKAIMQMEEVWGVRPRLLCFDYVQIIPSRGQDDRVKRVAEMPLQVKRLAQRLKVPVFCGAQASREVDALKIKLPEMSHAQWGSSIEQAADLVLSSWRPATTENIGDEVTVAKRKFTVAEDLFFLQMLKQRGDAGRWTWALHFEPQYLKLAEIETRYPDYGN